MNPRLLRRRERALLLLYKPSPHLPLWAFVGTIITAVSLVPKTVGIYLVSRAIGSMKFGHGEDTSVVVAEISRAAAELGDAGNWLALGNLLLLIGGVIVTWVLYKGGFRARWFFWALIGLTLFVIWQPWVGTTFGLLWLISLILFGSDFFAAKGILVPEETGPPAPLSASACAAIAGSAAKNGGALPPNSPQFIEAVLFWTGFGRYACPWNDEAAFVTHYGREIAAWLLPAVQSLEADFFSSNAHQAAEDLQEMGQMASEDFRRRHPGVPEKIVEAFAWGYTFSHK